MSRIDFVDTADTKENIQTCLVVRSSDREDLSTTHAYILLFDPLQPCKYSIEFTNQPARLKCSIKTFLKWSRETSCHIGCGWRGM